MEYSDPSLRLATRGGRAKIHLFKFLAKHQSLNLWFITNSAARVDDYKRAF